jgi:CubicO group peptidase (beta-lactamase class C family)
VRSSITSLLLLSLLLPADGCARRSPVPDACPRAGNEQIADVLEPILRRHRLPSMGAAITTTAGELEIAVVGVKKAGGDVTVALEDRWHIGSCGKAMNATVIARLVERGQLRWDTTVGEAFPDLASSSDSPLAAATLAQLLPHHAGLPRDLDYDALMTLGRPRRQRLEAVHQAGSLKLLHPPGTAYAYSNLGYVIAGAVIEQTLDRPYEEVMEEMLFTPTGMDSAGFEGGEGPVSGDPLWAHHGDGRPVRPDRFSAADPPALRPAGCIRCTLADWARFISHHLRGEAGQSPFLDAETFKKLHRPHPHSEYAMGWSVVSRQWGGGTVLHHAGSNGLNYSNVWIAPKRGFAVLVCTNQGDSFEATDEAAGALIELHGRWLAEGSVGWRQD